MILNIRRRLARGQVLVIFAVSSVALFGIAALAIDGARILMTQRQLQNAVDGAALTGALDIGPGAGSDQTGTAEDDVVYAIENALGIDFSNNYTVGHHLTTNPCSGIGCNSSTTPRGPYNPVNAASPCCLDWTDTTGVYKLNIRTPYSYAGTTEPESYIWVDLTLKYPLLIAPGAWNVNVTVSTIALNHAIPYSMFLFKHNDTADITNGNNNTISTNKRIGVNGSVTTVGGGGMGINTVTFTCTTPPTPANWGGDIWEYTVIAGTAAINTLASIGEGSCPTTTGTSTYKTLTNYIYPPNVHLPQDPYGAGGPALQGTINVSGTQVLPATRSSDPTQPWGPRYSTVNVSGSGNTLILEPGVYFFEGSGAGSGLRITSGGTVYTGDCYLSVLPNCWTPGSGAPAICTAGPLPLAIGGSRPFHCTSDNDFGVLLVFYPSGSDSSSGVSCTNVNPAASTNYYCTVSSQNGGSDTQLQVQSGSNIYISSSPKYHAVSLFVDSSHPIPSTTWNFTDPTKLAAAGCASVTCALQIGIGSHLVYVQGGGSVSINGAILAPADNVFLGGGGNGKGYGQILAYTANFIGNAAIKESYNPIALAYTPVIVQ
jgi:Flp pilus assembly protein TadG